MALATLPLAVTRGWSGIGPATALPASGRRLGICVLGKSGT